jgi:predicted DNA-binding protein (UPF0278 family)
MVVMRIKPDQEKLKAFMLDQGVTLVDCIDAVISIKQPKGHKLEAMAEVVKQYILSHNEGGNNA